jgi:RNA polymerase sigma factor (sigma-70 family)
VAREPLDSAFDADTAALDGDVAAFERVFRRYHASLCDVVAGYVGSQDVAEEIVQELFLAIWTEPGRYAVRGGLRAYLFAAARNRARQHLRHEAVGRRWLEISRHEASPPGMAAPAPDAHVQIVDAESVDALRHAIADLPDRTRTALILRWEHSMSFAAVAECMGISVKGVEKLMSIAMRRLREALGVTAPR